MAQNIATLAVKFTADTSGLKTGTHEAAEHIGKWNDLVGNGARSLAGKAGLGGVFAEADEVVGAFMELGPAGGIAAAAFVAVGVALELGHKAFEQFLHSAERIGSLERMAERLDVSYASMQGLSFAAERNHLELERVAKAMEYMAKVSISARDAAHGHTRSLAKLTQSGRETADAFGKLGRATDKLEGMGLEEQFIIQAKSIGEIKDPVLRASEGLRVFGKNAGPMIPLMKHLGEDLERSSKYAERFGFAIEDVDSRNVERMNNAWEDMVFIGSQLADKFVSKFGGPVATLLENVIHMTESWADNLSALGVTWDDVGGFATSLMSMLNADLMLVNGVLEISNSLWMDQLAILHDIAAFVSGDLSEAFAAANLHVAAGVARAKGEKSIGDVISGKAGMDFRDAVASGSDFSKRGGFGHGLGAGDSFAPGALKDSQAAARIINQVVQKSPSEKAAEDTARSTAGTKDGVDKVLRVLETKGVVLGLGGI